MTNRIWKKLAACFVVFVVTLGIVAAEANGAVPPELNAYIDAPDNSFAWKITSEEENSTAAMYTVELTSQTWHGITWKHAVYIVSPKTPRYSDAALIYIGGGKTGGSIGDGDKMLAKMLATASGMTVTILLQVPNQPLFGDYVEDGLIGETMLKAIADKDTTWPLLFPMAKSAIRAMDMTDQLIKEKQNRNVKRFVVSGASKRGWTTWLTAASGDKRVCGIAPIVIDTLNMNKQMEYQVETWGTHSDSIHDYTSRNLVRKDGELSPFEQKLWEMIDPYSYRERYTMPKLLIHGSNDPYWTVDAVKHYWGDLPGVKYILTLPNVGHDLGNEKIRGVQTLAVFARHAAANSTFPNFTWSLDTKDSDYVVHIDTEFPAERFLLWTATSETKDFRKSQWTSREVNMNDPISVPKPKSGHVAFFVELRGSYYDLPCSLTTQVWRY
ncbi:MAG: PhoPQ-activated pathogenicity-related family protein [Thermoguttaceae bacterium]